MVRLLAPVLIVLGLLLAPAANAAPPPEEALARIKTLNTTLLEVMQQADRLGYQGRYQKLAPVLSQIFNFRGMARVSVGQETYDALEPAKQEKLVDAFTRMSVATFASRFDGYSGERFEVLGTEPAGRDSLLVKTNLVKSSGTPVALNYFMRPVSNTWQVLDIYMETNFSELARRRSEFTSVLSREGFDGLIRHIDDLITRTSTGKG